MTDNFERALQERLLARSQVSARDVEDLRLFARTLPARRSFWSGPVLRFAMSAAAVALAAAVAIPVLQRLPGFGSTPSPTPVPTTPVVVFPTGQPASPDPTTAPEPTPSWEELPADGPVMDLVIRDFDGLIDGAVVVRGDTMTLRWSDFDVEQVEPNVVRVLWSAYPTEDDVQIRLIPNGSGGVTIEVSQKMPPALSDELGQDRELTLRFVEPIDAADVEVTFIER